MLLALRKAEFDKGNYHIAVEPLLSINASLDEAGYTMYDDQNDASDNSMSSFDMSSITPNDLRSELPSSLPINAEPDKMELLHTSFSSQQSLFDMSSITLSNAFTEDEIGRESRRRRSDFVTEAADAHHLTVFQVDAYERACSLAKLVAATDKADMTKPTATNMSKQTVLCVTFILLALCFLNFTIVNRDSTEFVGRRLSKSLHSEDFKLALCFCTGVSAPMLINVCSQLLRYVFIRETNLNLTFTLTCGVLNLSVLLPHLIMFIWTTQEKEFSSFYVVYYCFQYCIFGTIVCSIFTQYLPDIWAFRQGVFLFGFLFVTAFILYAAVLNFPHNLKYSQLVYVICAMLSLALIAYIVFLWKFIVHIVYPLAEKLSREVIFISVTCNMCIILFIIFDYAAIATIRSVRMSDFDTFNVCWHAYIKVCRSANVYFYHAGQILNLP